MSAPIYLDGAATSFPKAPGVPEAVADFLRSSAGNPGRGGHRLTVAASRVVEAARTSVATLLGGDPERTLFVPGCTFALNTVLFGLLGPGDRVVCSALEHNAVMRPLRALEAGRGVRIRVLRGEGPAALPTVDEVRAAIAEAPTRLVVLPHASNVSGAVLPIAALTAAAAPVPVLIDAAQSAGSVALDFAATGAAALCCSGHKGLLGPTGIGVLLLAPWFSPPPLVLGGTGSRSASEEMPDALPDAFEAGTPNTAGIAGLAAACAWVADRGVDALHAHALALVRRGAEGLAGLPGVELVGGPFPDAHTGTLSFRVHGADLGEMALWLDREAGLQLRAGLHCAPAAHRRLGTFPDGTLRAAFGPFNAMEHADSLVAAVARYQRERPSTSG
jgi:selenocysteine lyase/cysteine desulfurase